MIIRRLTTSIFAYTLHTVLHPRTTVQLRLIHAEWRDSLGMFQE